jgi:tungstate transport system substrate-binding protein
MSEWNRRQFITASASAAALAACHDAPQGEIGEPDPPPTNPGIVRISSVPTAIEGNILPALVDAFEKQSSLKVSTTLATDLYTQARAGKVDLAISHYGHHEAEQFILDGLGEWPRTIFSNQVALVGPASDPAGVRGLDDAGEALRRISTSGSPFLVNEIDGLSYLTEVLWHLAGQPARTNWLHGHKQDDALIEAAKRNAYTMWGLTPFMRVRKREHLQLEPLVLGDPLFQRLLVSVVIKPKIGGVNVAGATAFEQFLLEPSTQALMRTVDYSDDHTKLARWMPAGRHNRVAVLPKSKLT